MAIVVNGLANNKNYYIENDLWVKVTESSVQNIASVNVQVEGVNSSFTYYPNRDNEIYFNLSPVFKHAFPNPQDDHNYINPNRYVATTNLLRRRVYIFVNYTDTTTSNVSYLSNYIRGYIDTQQSNVTAPYNTWLTNSEKIPVWAGFPSFGYQIYINTDQPATLEEPVNNIYKYIALPDSIKEEMSVRNCDGKYVKFLNSRGGYSAWLFEKWEYTNDADPLGYTRDRDDIVDFGSYPEFEVELESKVPRRYLGLMRDLLNSKEIYIYNPSAGNVLDKWTRVILGKGSIPENNYKEAYQIKFTFEKSLRYNPALRW